MWCYNGGDPIWELAVRARVLGLDSLTLSKSCESSLYAQRLARLQRKLPPQGIHRLEPTRRLTHHHVFQDMSSRSFSLWRCDIGLVFMHAFSGASKVGRTYQHGPRVNPQSIPPTHMLVDAHVQISCLKSGLMVT